MSGKRTTSIARIGLRDLPRVRSLACRIWPECFAGILETAHIDAILADVYDLAALRADVERHSHIYWIARVEGADVGYASAYREGDRLWIKKLYLLDVCRGLGLGKQLMATAHAAFPGVSSLALYVNDGNAPAIGFYQSQGFVIEKLEPIRMGPIELKDYVMVRPA